MLEDGAVARGTAHLEEFGHGISHRPGALADLVACNRVQDRGGAGHEAEVFDRVLDGAEGADGFR